MIPYPSPYPSPIPTWVHLSSFEVFAMDPRGLMLWVSLAVLAICIIAMLKSRGN